MSPLSPVGRSYYMLRLSWDFQGTDFSSLVSFSVCVLLRGCESPSWALPRASLRESLACYVCRRHFVTWRFHNSRAYLVLFRWVAPHPCGLSLQGILATTCWPVASSDLALFVRGGPSAVSFYHEPGHLSGPCEWGGHLAETALYCPICCVWLLLIYFSSSFIQMREPFFLWWNGASLAVFLSSCHLFQVVRWCALPITVLIPLQK